MAIADRFGAGSQAAEYAAQNAGLDAAGAAASDAGLSALGYSNPYTALIAAIPELVQLFGGPDINPLDALMGLIGGGRPKMEATSEIAAGGKASSDPVLELLGMGAGGLSSSGTPISSPKAGPSFGPYFNVARSLEDLLRWGPAGLKDPKLQQLDAQTLQNALHDLGNKGDTTTGELERTYRTGSKYLTPENIQLLEDQIGPWGSTLVNQLLNRGDNPRMRIPTNGISNVNNTNSLLQLFQRPPTGFGMGWTTVP